MRARTAAWRPLPRQGLYYGWVVWLVAAIGMAASSPGQSYSVSLFIDSFITDFGLDRTTVSSLFGAGTFIASLALIWIGRQVDRAGNRRAGVAIGLCFGAALLLCAIMTGPLLMLLAFVGIRAFGQGALTLVSSTAVANWFRARRGRAMAYLALAYTLFQGAYVNGLRLLLDALDWRQVFALLGIGVMALVLPLFAFVMRDKPEDMGLRPDNLAVDDSTEAIANESSWTLRQALRTPVLWIYGLARMLPSAWGTGLILHQISIFGELGHAAHVATGVFALSSVISAGSALFTGWMIDRFSPALAVALNMLMMLGCCLLATVMSAAPLLLLYALTFGIGMGIGYVFDGAVWANLYGRSYQGEIRGFVFTMVICGSAVGPALFGFSLDAMGSYAPALLLGAAMAAVLMLLALITPLPKRS